MNKKEVVEWFLKKDYLVSPCFLDSYGEEVDDFGERLKGMEKPVILNKDILGLLKNKSGIFEINWLEFEKSRTNFEKKGDRRIYEVFLKVLSHEYLSGEEGKEVEILSQEKGRSERRILLDLKKKSNEVIVLKNYIDEVNKKKTVGSFVNYFRSRYYTMRGLLIKRPDLVNTISISKVLNKKDREIVVLIGLVVDKRVTKNGNILLKLEDNTGSVNIIVNKTKEELFKLAKDITLDEAIGVVGSNGEGIVFVNNLYLPDVPLNKEIKKSDEDVCVGVISDIHVGSKNFLEKEFLDFIEWLNGKGENKKHRELALKIKYLLIVGDLIDGVGIYPDQEKDLFILDVKDQYDKLAYYLSMIREDIKIIISPGNHDAMRLSLPQPILDKDLAEGIHKLKNVVLVTNPSYVNIGSSETFQGFDVLIYHGSSFHYYIDTVDSLRLGKARDYPSKVSEYLLKRRHLAPSHTSTLYIPDEREDPLIINKVPDIIVTGEMHRTDVSIYNNVVIINSSCWQSKTEYEEKTGNNPDPGKFPILNLKTREVNILKFYDETS